MFLLVINVSLPILAIAHSVLLSEVTDAELLSVYL